MGGPIGRERRTPGAASLFISDEQGRGLPVLFLNSLAADTSMWSGVRRRLTGRRNVCFDARGHGRSDVVAGDCNVEDLGRDALAVLDTVGIERAVLCGLSLGGLVAIQVAALARDRVAGLVLANTAVSFPPAGMWRERSEAARSGRFDTLIAPTLERWLTPGFAKADPEAAAAVRAMIGRTPPEGYAACCAALAQADLGDALAGYGGPVLLLAGRYDPSTPPARAKEMKALAPQARLVELEAAHLSAVEAEAAFAAALEEFVAKVEADGSDHG